MSYDTEHYYALHTFLEDDELHKIWNIVEKAMNRHGFDVSNSELSMRLYDQELEENIEHDYMAEYLESLSEGKDQPVDKVAPVSYTHLRAHET